MSDHCARYALAVKGLRVLCVMLYCVGKMTNYVGQHPRCDVAYGFRINIESLEQGRVLLGILGMQYIRGIISAVGFKSSIILFSFFSSFVYLGVWFAVVFSIGWEMFALFNWWHNVVTTIWIHYLSHMLIFCILFSKKVNRKVQEEPRAEATAKPRYQEEEKK